MMSRLVAIISIPVSLEIEVQDSLTGDYLLSKAPVVITLHINGIWAHHDTDRPQQWEETIDIDEASLLSLVESSLPAGARVIKAKR